MAATKSSFLDKVLGRIGRLDAEGLQTVVQRLARERSFLETLFNTIEDGVLVADEHGRVIYFNEAVTRLLGPQAGAEEQHISELLPELDWQSISRLDAAGGQRVVRREFEVHYPRPRFLRLYAAPLDGEAAGSSGVALILHDATEARQQTFEAIESERIQALTLLAASVAHEIGNPLNALHIHLQLMERELRRLKPPATRFASGVSQSRSQNLVADHDTTDIARKLEEYLAVAKGEIHRLDYIVTQFLQAIRPVPPQLKPGSLNEVVEKTLELLRPELDNRGLNVKTKFAARLPMAPIDATQIQQVLVNLFRNALEAMAQAPRRELIVTNRRVADDMIEIEVSDTGSGFHDDVKPNLFQTFFTTKETGMGVGLSISRSIIEAHGGRMWAEDNAAGGATFRFTLPAAANES